MTLKKTKKVTLNNKLDKGTRIKEMHHFAELYAKKTNTFFCLDPSITSVIIAGLADYKDKYQLPLCPCRNFRSERVEIELNFWICPCVAMRERKECHCKLFQSKSLPQFYALNQDGLFSSLYLQVPCTSSLSNSSLSAAS